MVRILMGIVVVVLVSSGISGCETRDEQTPSVASESMEGPMTEEDRAPGPAEQPQPEEPSPSKVDQEPTTEEVADVTRQPRPENTDRADGGDDTAGEREPASEDEAMAPAPTEPAGDCAAISQALVDQGRELFAGKGNCAACHGAGGEGGPVGPDLTDEQWINADGTLGSIADVVRSGVTEPKEFPAPMPPLGGAALSPEEVCAVAAYVHSL